MLIIRKALAVQIIAHARSCYPYEACGLLSGQKGTVERVYYMANTDKSPTTYFMDPREQIKAMKEIRTQGHELVGIYHSHPESEAYPSAHDIELALYPESSYLIVSLKDKDEPRMCSYKIVDGTVSEENVTIT